MRIPFVPEVRGKVGGGLVFGQPQHQRILRSPIGWEAPTRLDNSGYCTPLENQGQNPWCAAYAMCQLLQASYWRQHNARKDFNEAVAYATAKEIDKSPGDGTTLEAIVTAAQTVDLSDAGIMPGIVDQVLVDAGDVPFAVHRYGLVLVGLQITEGWRYTRWGGMIGNDDRKIGGHAVLVSGYDLEERTIRGPNWWGRGWGQNGYWRMTLDQFEAQFTYGYGCAITWSHS